MSSSTGTPSGWLSRAGVRIRTLPTPRPPLSRAAIDTTLARLEGGFGFIFALLSLPTLSASAHTLKPEWAWGISIALFGSIAATAICAVIVRGIRVSTGILAGVFVVTLLLWPFAVRSPEAAVGTQPWLWYIVLIAIGAAGISFSTRWAAVYTVAVPAVFSVLRVMPAGGGASLDLALLDAIYSLLLGSFVVIVITLLRSTASQVDEAQALAAERYAAAAKRAAAEQERTRVDTVIHDRVLSTLLAAARAQTPADRVMSVQMAERALVALQSADAETRAAPDTTVQLLADRCRALTRAFDVEIGFTQHGDLAARVPARVVEGVYAATVQAIVNSVEHAGPAAGPGAAAGAEARTDGGTAPDDVYRRISVRGRGAEGFTVVIGDTGRGFDVDAVPADRLGVRISIRERVDSVGGTVSVRSAPGQGTTVEIGWAQADQGGGFA